ncbi:MAG: uroporphyrinogen-III synthase [Rickettsiales bacterium]|nr:uroporphyrinogen-III synthase [Rickettsiales bacterium]
MTTLLITRPIADSKSLEKDLENTSIKTAIDPMLRIETIDSAEEKVPEFIELKPQAIILTSKHALEGFKDVSNFNHIPMLAVGARTAEYAQSLGFKNVTVTGENVEHLIEHIKKERKPIDGPLLYLSGEEVTADLDKELDGFDVGRLITYRAHIAKRFSGETARMLSKGALDGAVFFSPRSAKAFMHCLKEAKQEETLKKLVCLCLSEAVAAELPKEECKALHISERPTQNGMVDLILKHFGSETAKATETKTTTIEVDEGDEPSPFKTETISTIKHRRNVAKDYIDQYPMQPQEAPSSGSGFLTGLVVLLFVSQLGLGGYIAYKEGWLPIEPMYDEQEIEEEEQMVEAFDRSELDRQITAAWQRMDQLENSFESAAKTAESLKDSQDKTPMLIEELANLKAENESLKATLEETLERLAKTEQDQLSDARVKELISIKDKVEKLHQNVTESEQEKWQKIQMLTTYDQLRQSVLSGKPYANPFKQFETAASDDKQLTEMVTSLAEYKDKGVPTLKALKAHFAEAIKTHWHMSVSGEDDQWADIRRNLSELIVIRKVGETHMGDDAASVIARAEAQLSNDKIGDATALIAGLDDKNKLPFNTWLSDAQSYMKAQQLLQQINVAMLQSMKPNHAQEETAN